MKKFYRSKSDKKIFGVCGGIAEMYDFDPAVVRLLFVFLCLATGGFPLLVTYFIARFLLPTKQL